MKEKLMTLLFFLVIIILTFFTFLFIDPNFIYLMRFFTNFAYQQRMITTIFYICIVIICFIFYAIFLQKIKKNQLSPTLQKGLIIFSILILLFSYPAMLSFDIFNYIATAKVLFLYHENPYLIKPIEFAGDPILLFMHAPNKTALYGPVWILLTGIPYFLGLGNFLLTVFFFKALLIPFFMGTLFFIKKLSEKSYSVFLFALNPLVLFETFISGHNDITMVFLILGSFFFLKKKRILIGIILFLLSIGIKYATVCLLPIVLYVVIKKKNILWERLFFYSAYIMLGVVLLIAPFREEIYPWYALWFFSFACLIPQKKMLLWITLSITFGLLFRYVPFMLLGTYFGPTPLIKSVVVMLPPLTVIVYFFIKKKKWLEG